MIPASSLSTKRNIDATSVVYTLADRPKRTPLATRSADSVSGTRISERTGPKISSCAMRMSAATLSKIAGATKKPRSHPASFTRVPPRTRRAPSLRPIST
jgi:hypothetical protein